METLGVILCLIALMPLLVLFTYWFVIAAKLEKKERELKTKVLEKILERLDKKDKK